MVSFPLSIGMLKRWCALALALGTLSSMYAGAAFAADKDATPGSIHLGPMLTAYVQRGSERLPLFLVDHLHKGDRITVASNKGDKTAGAWLLVLAAIAPADNGVEAAKFDLTEQNDPAYLDIDADDQVPVIVLAPQVRTMFGMRTSFSESSALIVDAIKSDPQRFIDLQKIDEINHAIALVSAALDAAIQSQKPDQAVPAAKALAARFGARSVDPSCFKDGVVNTRCVAVEIVTNKDLSLPDDMWSGAGPNSSAAKIPTDLSATLKIVTEASTYLTNKFGDNYDFAPASGRRAGSEVIQLVTSARFKNGDVKTAYVYVPSWFAGKPPEISFPASTAACLSRNELQATLKGRLPLTNYWHDWRLALHAADSVQTASEFDDLDFRPDQGVFKFDFKHGSKELPADGKVYDATLSGKFGFASVQAAPFRVVLSSGNGLPEKIEGLDTLVAGEHGKLHVGGTTGDGCVEQLALVAAGKTIASSGGDAHDDLAVDLSKTEPGPATLEIREYGQVRQDLPVIIRKHRAHLQRLVHFDLETDVTVYGDNLERIAALEAGHEECKPATDEDTPETPGARVFSCPADIAANANFPAQVTVRHVEHDPSSFSFPATKIAARPHMTVEGVPSSIVTLLSPQAAQWGLSPDDKLVTQDSGMGLLLHAYGGYRLSRGAYVLQLKFADDPHTEEKPISVPLMSDLAHNELRTREPVAFANAQLPSIVNPIFYRVQHQPTGLVGDWLPLNRSAVFFPQFGNAACASDGKGMFIPGERLELIDWASADMKRSIAAQQADADSGVAHCAKGLCLAVDELGAGKKLKIKLHWIDDRLFDVAFPDAPKCGALAKD